MIHLYKGLGGGREAAVARVPMRVVIEDSRPSGAPKESLLWLRRISSAQPFNKVRSVGSCRSDEAEEGSIMGEHHFRPSVLVAVLATFARGGYALAAVPCK
jgi:hypothetical protein